MISKINTFSTLLLSLTCHCVFSQTIINTENLMRELDEKMTYSMGFKGDFNFGNIDLIQFSTAHQFAQSVDRSLFRILLNYDFIEESNQIIASDFTGQFRYNYRIEKNSIFGFFQAQNLKSLRMNHRFISGGGYRHNLWSKGSDYFDLSAGLFFEDELYDKDLPTQTQVYNWRYSFSGFSKYSFTEKTFINLSVYYQIKTANSEDYRLFVQPRLYYTLPKFDIFLDLTYRYHSTPYVPLYQTDTSLELGVEFQLN